MIHELVIVNCFNNSETWDKSFLYNNMRPISIDFLTGVLADAYSEIAQFNLIKFNCQCTIVVVSSTSGQAESGAHGCIRAHLPWQTTERLDWIPTKLWINAMIWVWRDLQLRFILIMSWSEQRLLNGLLIVICEIGMRRIRLSITKMSLFQFYWTISF